MPIRRKTTKKKSTRRAALSIGDIKKILSRLDKTSSVLERTARELRYEAEKIQKRPGVVGAAASNMKTAARQAETTLRVFDRVLERELERLKA